MRMLTDEQVTKWLLQRMELTDEEWNNALNHPVNCACCSGCIGAREVIAQKQLILEYLREERRLAEQALGSARPTIGNDHDASDFWEWWQLSCPHIDLWSVIAALMYHHQVPEQVDKDTRTCAKLFLMGIRSRINK